MAFYEILKDAAKVAKDVGRADLQEKIIELIGKMGEMAEQNADLREENARLREAVNLKANMIFEDPFYLRDGWPHCPNCFDGDGRAIRLVDFFRSTTGGFGVFCKRCKTHYSMKTLPAAIKVVKG